MAQPTERSDLHEDFHKVMCSDAVAKIAYDRARQFDTEEDRLKAVIITLSRTHFRLLSRLKTEKQRERNA